VAERKKDTSEDKSAAKPRTVSRDHTGEPGEGEIVVPGDDVPAGKSIEQLKTEPRDFGDTSRYPEGSPAREGNVTPPTGQGGLSPMRRPDHQDMFPPNHIPAETQDTAKGDPPVTTPTGEVA
jgi:hypothetical protein